MTSLHLLHSGCNEYTWIGQYPVDKASTRVSYLLALLTLSMRHPLGQPVAAATTHFALALELDQLHFGVVLVCHDPREADQMLDIGGTLGFADRDHLGHPRRQAARVDIENRHDFEHARFVRLSVDRPGAVHVGAHDIVGILERRTAAVLDRVRASRPPAPTVFVHERIHVFHEQHVAPASHGGSCVPERPPQRRGPHRVLVGRHDERVDLLRLRKARSKVGVLTAEDILDLGQGRVNPRGGKHRRARGLARRRDLGAERVGAFRAPNDFEEHLELLLGEVDELIPLARVERVGREADGRVEIVLHLPSLLCGWSAEEKYSDRIR
jgi:hypothetical protein